MRLEQRATIQAPRARVWDFLVDVPRVAKCVPGAEAVEDLGDDKYRGAIKVRVGPIGLTLRGDVSVIELDPDTGTARMKADAADRRVGGAVKAEMHMTVTETSGASPSTELRIVTEAQVMGRIGDFGQPVIRKKADQMMQQFAENLRRAIAEEDPSAVLESR